MKKCYALIALLFYYHDALAASYVILREGGDSIVGEVEYATASKEESLVDIARRFDLGYDEIVKANPGIDRWTPGEGTRVMLPTRYVLPDVPRKGIVLNLAELRMYYFPPSEGLERQQVYTFPISIGRMDWKSPLGNTKIIKKEKDPEWRPTESIKAEHAAGGEVLPNVVSGGVPENPLGRYALRLGIPGYLIHGTDEKKEFGIGMRVTHGCVRMYPEDIELLYSRVDTNTPVLFIDQPVKAGWLGGELYIEVHAPLEEDSAELQAYSHRVTLEEATDVISRRATSAVPVDVGKVSAAVERADGIPIVVGTTASALPPARQ